VSVEDADAASGVDEAHRCKAPEPVCVAGRRTPENGVWREIMGIVLIGARPLSRLAWMVALAALGGYAQTPGQAAAAAIGTPATAVQVGVKLSPELARRVEVMVRNKSSIGLDYAMSFSLPTQSEIPGYDQVIATFTEMGEAPRTATFLLSTDGKTLAQFNKLDLSKDPKDVVSQAGRPARGGGPNSPVLIVGFDDLECPFCAKMNAELIPAILSRYKDQVRIVYRDFPLDQHPWAMHAAVDANCLAAGSTEGYWNYVDYVHAHSEDIPYEEKSIPKADQMLDKLALDEGARQKVNQPELVACVLKQDTAKVKASVDEALQEPLDVGQTPVLFINGEKVTGVVPVETIYQIIDGALIAAGQTPPPAPPAQPAAPATKPGS
jgi:protein-disulfide isomerase